MLVVLRVSCKSSVQPVCLMTVFGLVTQAGSFVEILKLFD